MEQTLVYRVLRPNEVEGAMINGLTAKYTGANMTVRDHVDHGSTLGFESQYISTGKDKSEIDRFAKIGMQNFPGPKYIATINLAGLTAPIIDLTDQVVLNQQIPPVPINIKARNFATKFQEELVVGHIPAGYVVSVNIIQ